MDLYIKRGGDFDRNHRSIVKLKELFGNLNKLNLRNEILIKSNLQISDNIVRMYKSHLEQYKKRQSVYDENGTVVLHNKNKKTAPTMGLNNEI